MKVRAIAGGAAILLAGAVGVGVAATGAGGATRSGTQHFFITANTPDGAQSVQAIGPIVAKGRDRILDDNHDRFEFPNGTITVRHHISSSHESIDDKNCVFDGTETGTFTIVKATGAYAKVRGYGSYQAHFIAAACHEDRPPTALMGHVDASGPITLG